MDILTYANNIDDLICLTGDFKPMLGPVEPTEDGCRFTGEELEVTVRQERHASGVILRQDSVRNLSRRPITLRTAMSRFRLDGWEKEVYTQFSQPCYESCGQWQSLVTEISAHNCDLRSGFGGVPFVGVYDLQTHRGAAFHLADSCLWRIFVRREFLSRPRVRAATVELGPDPLNFTWVLQPGETFTLPGVVYYEFRNKTDMDAYKLHRWCRDRWMPQKFPVAYNTWLCKFGLISFELLVQQLEVAQELGMEYFVVDAGWFCEGAQWATGLGDWEEATDCSMHGRMKEFADLVRAKGLKFGLWFEIERAAPESEAYRSHPEYYLVEQNIALIDFSNPDACDYAFAMVEKNILKYGIEYIKFDFNRIVYHDPTGTAFLKYYEGYGAFIRRIRETFPGIYLEGCASGGLRMTLSSLKYFDSFWLSDQQNQREELRIFKDTVLRMPARALEKWLSICTVQDQVPATKEGTQVILTAGDRGWKYVESITDEFLMASLWGGPMSLSCDLTMLSSSVKEKLAARIAEYKTQREFWLKAETRILTDTPAMLVLQFSDEAFSELRICAFAGVMTQNHIAIFPVCDPDARYRDEEGTEYSGRQLTEDGIRIPCKINRSAAELRLWKI